MATGKLLIGLGIIFYSLFFLLPDSSTQIVAFPWVLFAGTGLLCFNLALLVNLWRNYLGNYFSNSSSVSAQKSGLESAKSLTEKPENQSKIQSKIQLSANHQSGIFALGYGLDIAVIITVISVIIASIRAQFVNPSWWYGLGVIGALGAIYGLRQTLDHKLNYETDANSHDGLWRLLRFQGILSLIFTVESLGLWLWQTFLPRWQYIQQLQQWGLFLNYDFNDLESRNWAPLGHQNYVAGVLILSIPLWITLGLRHFLKASNDSINHHDVNHESASSSIKTLSSKVSLVKRLPWVWLGAIVLGFINLYTTSSRGGFLGLGVLMIYGLIVVIAKKTLPKIWLWGGTAALTAIILIMVQSNNRLKTLFAQILSQWQSTGQNIGQNTGQNIGNSSLSGGAPSSVGETLFRTITTEVGWRMGLDHCFSGAGLGNVPLLYQKYRPQWAGREAEWMFQLHNTPAQLWAELGVMGVIAVGAWISALIWLFWRLHRSSQWQGNPFLQIATYGIFGSLLSYSVVAITDFQLDVPAISGFLVVLIVGLAYIGALAAPVIEPITEIITEPVPEPIEKKIPIFSIKTQRGLSVIGLAGLIATLIWTTPILLAWQSSSVGFILLRNGRITLTEYTKKVGSQTNSQNNSQNNLGANSSPTKPPLDFSLNSNNSTANEEANQLLNIALGEIDGFRQKLENAHKLAPWQTYYAYQLGWNLAELSINYPNLPQVQEWQREGLQWLQEASRSSPYTESAYNSIGWLSLSQGQPQTASTAFRNGLNLIASKRSLQLGLGISLWQQGNKDQAVAAFAQEILNEPSFITSPIWETPQMTEAYPLLCEFLTRPEMQKAFAAKFSPEFAARFLVLVHWWQGKPINDVIQELTALNQPVTNLLVQVLRNDRQALGSVIEQPRTGTEMMIAAWYRPQERSQLIEKAYVHATRNLPSANLPLLAAIGSRMQEMQAQSNSGNPSVNPFDQLLRGKLERQSPLILKYRRTRLGFGVVSRQIDGPIPSDFFQTEDRALISLFFSDLFN